MIAAVMAPSPACRPSPHRASPAVATPPASGASRPGSAGGARRLDALRRRTRRRRQAEQAKHAEVSTAGNVKGSGVYNTRGGTVASVMTGKDASKVPGRCAHTDLAGADEPRCFAVNETFHYKE